jgi:uracil-DNA glycosylase family 4
MFTGDASGNFLFPALWRQGFASQPTANCRSDGLFLTDLFITAAVRCVPPKNKPTRQELVTCRRWLARDLALPKLRCLIALGRIAHEAYLDLLREKQVCIVKARLPFAHGAFYAFEDWPALLDCYHVSFQNTNTGRLRADMLDAVLQRARQVAGLPPGQPTRGLPKNSPA